MPNQKITPFIWCNNTAEESAEFYASVFPHAHVVSHNPMVSVVEIEGATIQLLNGGPMFKPNPSISFFFDCTSEETITRVWNALIDGGNVMMELSEYPWSKKYGWCNDKYGVSWQLMFHESENGIHPSFLFTQHNAGKAEEALTFYTQIFENSSIEFLSRYEEGQGDVVGTLNYARFVLEGQVFSAMDSSKGHEFIFTEGVSLMVSCKDQAEIDYFWDTFISNGGSPGQCGWLKDRYGISWQIIPQQLSVMMGSGELAATQRVVAAFMKMQKFNLAELERAFQG